MDDSTGLQNNLNRWYSPKIGRWMDEDSLGFSAGDNNLYRYVSNSPTKLIDPSGLEESMARQVDRTKWGPLSGRIAELGAGRGPVEAVTGIVAVAVGIFDAAIPAFFTLGADSNAKLINDARSNDPKTAIPASVTLMVMLESESIVNAPGVLGGVYKGLGAAPAAAKAARMPSSPKAYPPSAGSPLEGASTKTPGVSHVIPEGRVGHIFRNAEGHLPNTPDNQTLLKSVADDPSTTLGVDKFGNTWSARTLPDGSQVWTQTRNGEIINGGLNQSPRNFNPQSGLSNPGKP